VRPGHRGPKSIAAVEIASPLCRFGEDDDLAGRAAGFQFGMGLPNVIELVYAVQRNDRVTGSDCVEKGLKYLRGVDLLLRRCRR
jgi:hypothetical protein